MTKPLPHRKLSQTKRAIIARKYRDKVRLMKLSEKGLTAVDVAYLVGTRMASWGFFVAVEREALITGVHVSVRAALHITNPRNIK